MRTFKLVLAGSIAALFTLGAAMAGEVTFRSPDDAMKQGISAFNGGYYELALPAFEALERTKPQIAHFYMARIYGDNEGAYTNHGKAFALYKALADELQNVDPDDDELAPIAAKSLTAVSMYLRDGIRDAGVLPDPEAADRALQRAALTFNDEDAQFELAKVLLRGEGPDIKMAGFEDPSSKIENGRHWLSASVANWARRRASVPRRSSVARQVRREGSDQRPQPDRRRGRECAAERACLDRGHLSEHLLQRRRGRASAGNGTGGRVAQSLWPQT